MITQPRFLKEYLDSDGTPGTGLRRYTLYRTQYKDDVGFSWVCSTSWTNSEDSRQLWFTITRSNTDASLDLTFQE